MITLMSLFIILYLKVFYATQTLEVFLTFGFFLSDRIINGLLKASKDCLNY